MIPGVNWNHSLDTATGLTATNPITVGAIEADSNLLAVIGEASGVVVTHDTTDFTVAAGSITAGTIDTSGQTLLVLWTNAPAV